MQPKPNPESFQATDVIRIDDVYGIINHVQMNLKKCSFIAHPVDAVTIETILRDTGLTIERVVDKTGTRFTIIPPEKKIPSDDGLSFDEDFEDELPEDGQCF